ncbi:Xaa-Pro peptidase family protein [Aneurinibacillus thermoaerophilus]|uniref:M24 family metallopeptidase n=1 Tax=Aneurinibacillus thermoaerophilus TaxID=143495 RepID=UPI002E1EB82C|nr:Xaa-Pro peptidase family protein [Aneurinibacillus thermoaerophilus]MED0679776.1 Xaa-Pro peptidase family protein [Aneurinibacillus thermoaerophilus]MED0735808.1 Xaa-Pro peptidase family protein [Aneurinibacillus thermoaerophilus]MED0763968.1 Xaa-Pro peptidase family protein [Aneurinibacillus thermoaerophilus]
MDVYGTRIDRLRKELEGRGADAALLTSPLSVAYLTGFVCDPHERFMALLLQEDKAVLFVPLLELEKAENALSATGAIEGEIIGVRDTDEPFALVKQNMKGAVRRMAVEKEYMRLSQAERLMAVSPGLQMLDAGHIIAKMRNKKTQEEVERIRAAVQLVEDVLAEGLTRVKAGITELELVAELEYIMKQKGADAPAFDTMVLAGANSALPHGVPGKTIVQEGGFLLFDLGVLKDGYCSDITRTFVIGEPSAEMEKIYDTVLRAEEAALRAVRVGRPLAEVDKAARNIINAAGYGPYFTHRVGHGLGMEVHEYPSVHGTNEELIEQGMVFTIEPGIYVPGVGGVRIEDDVYVAADGAQTLTAFPKALTKLEI